MLSGVRLYVLPDKDSKASGDEAVELEDKDEPRETAGPQLRSGKWGWRLSEQSPCSLMAQELHS
jgi:hypothetical protein